jgi:HK97 family phage major capsid protein
MSELTDLITQMKKEFAAYQDAFVERQNAAGARADELDIKLGRIENSLQDGSQKMLDMQVNMGGKIDEMEQVIEGLKTRKPVEAQSDYQRYAELMTEQSRQGVIYTPESVREYSMAFMAMLKNGQPSNLLSTESDPDGGYLVPPDMSGRMETLIRETSDVRSVATVTTTGYEALEGENDLGQVGFGWVGERAARTETTTSTLGQWRIPVHEMYAEPRATQRVIDDAERDVAAWLMSKVTDRMARGENEAFVNGTGVGQPRGIMTYPVNSAEVTEATWGAHIQYVASGHNTNAPSDATKLLDMLGSLKVQYLPRARFAMTRATLTAVRKITQTDMGLLFVPDFSMSPYGTILGHPISIFNDMAAIGTQNNLIIAFGDFAAAYQIVDRQGIRVVRDALTDKPYVKFYTTKRVGGDITNFEALTFMRQSAT